MQRRDINKVRKAIRRETDRRVAELAAEVQQAADGWDWMADQTVTPTGEVH